jgi:hypothetical protein
MVKKMTEIKLDGYCGLYCGACDIYRLSEKGKQTGVKAKWEEMPEQFKKAIKETDIVCHGCKSDTLFAGCRVCPIINAPKGKAWKTAPCARSIPASIFP